MHVDGVLNIINAIIRAGNFRVEKSSPPALLGEISSHINDYIVYTTWVKIYCKKYFCNVRVAGLGEILSSESFRPYGIIFSYLPKDHPFLQSTLMLGECDHNVLEMLCIV